MGPPLIFSGDSLMAKPYLNVDQQIHNLVSRKGLIINNVPFARRKLTDISYVSLIGGYKVPFIDPMTRRYVGNTTFEDIFALYRFDKELRLLTFGCLTTVEEKMRQLIVDAFCSRFGEQQTAYLNPKNYRTESAYNKSVTKLIDRYLKKAVSDQEHSYIVHQRRSHHNVPLWNTLKILTFGSISKMYSLLQYHQRAQIADEFPFYTDRALASAIDCMTYFRNVCAHNERLFTFQLNQRTFPDTPLHQKLAIPKKGNEYAVGKKDYFGLVISLRYILPRDEFLIYKRQLKRIINSYARKNSRLSQTELLEMMGMPENWEKLTSYKL